MWYFKMYCKSNYHEMPIPFCIFDWQTWTMKTWRDRARTAMKACGVTQEKLAELLEMTQGGVQHWLAGTRQPSLEDINRIAVLLKVAPAWLTHGLEQDDILNGLPDEARATLRRFIHAERSERSPSTVWAALNSIADLSLGADSTPRESNDKEHERLTRLIDSTD